MQAFTQVLYRLLDNPEYIEPLRREVEAIVAEDGWTKAAMDKMYKIDSFIRETQRIDVGGICLSAPSVAPQLLMLARKVGVTRRTVRPFTFSNGVTIPAGTLVSLPLRAVHRDGETYPNPEEFDGFRFSKLREQESDATVAKHQTISTSLEYLAFGLGRHQW